MANLGEDVCRAINSSYGQRLRVVTAVTKFGEYDTIDRVADMGDPVPPSGIEQGLTERLDNRTYYG